MSTTSENNKRIAKNTMLLYVRMLFTMAVSLYTSRVVLNTLGVEDFGIYNVVGGIVVMFSFFNSSLSTATQRFLNYEMGKGNTEKLKDVFSTALNGHYLIALLILILAETIGLWFTKTKLVIPAERMDAALWVYQFSIFSFLMTVISSPYNAAIIANERMKVFAYISILEASLKLLIVFLLVYLPFDKLILYGFLLFTISILIRSIYTIYCKKNFSECHYKIVWNKELFIRMFSFSGWMFAGTTTNMLSSQGINLLINIYFSPIQNAARGIAFQVQNAVNAFVVNFMTAVQPQIVKSYSQNDFKYMYQLVFNASKYSFYLLFLLSLPVLLQTDYLLQLWLKNVPDYAVLFTQLVVVDLLINSSFSPIASVSWASGKIRNYQLVIAVGFLTNFIMTWLFFSQGFSSYWAFIIPIIISFIGLFARLTELYYSVKFPIKNYIQKVFLKQIKVGALAVIVPLLYVHYTSPSFFQFAGTVALSSLSILVTIWYGGISSTEKIFVSNKIKSILKHKI